MTPFEMAQSCAKGISAAQECGLPMEQAPLRITSNGPWKKPAGFPRGRLDVVHPDGRRVYCFKAANVLAWLVSKKLVEVEFLPKEGGTRMEIKDTGT